jgi:hypothetical protein
MVAGESEERMKMGRESLETLIKDMTLNLTKEELPFAVQKALDDKHSEELNDMLMNLFEEKAKELKDEVLALLEEKLSKESIVKKDINDKLDVVDTVE